MAKLWQPHRLRLSVVALVLILAASAPIASMDKGGQPTACTTQQTNQVAQAATKAQKETCKQQQQNFESPVTYFKNIFSSDKREEDESEIAPQASTLVLAIKALAATLVSTII